MFEIKSAYNPQKIHNSINNLPLLLCDDSDTALANKLLSKAVGDGLAEETLLVEVLNRLFLKQIDSTNDPRQKEFLTQLQREAIQLAIGDLNFLSTELNASQRSRWSKLEFSSYRIEKLALFPLIVIKTVSAIPLLRLRHQLRKGFTTREKLTVDSGMFPFLLGRILDVFIRRKLFADAPLRKVTGFLRVVGVAIELSTDRAEWWRKNDSQDGFYPSAYLHIDQTLENPKAILYLTSVSKHSGPFEMFPTMLSSLKLTPLQLLIGRAVAGVFPRCVCKCGVCCRQTSSRCQRCQQDFISSLPQALQFNSHFGWDIPDETPHTWTELGKCVRVTGGAGTAVLFDGARTVHRGGLVQLGTRAALQIVLSYS